MKPLKSDEEEQDVGGKSSIKGGLVLWGRVLRKIKLRCWSSVGDRRTGEGLTRKLEVWTVVK